MIGARRPKGIQASQGWLVYCSADRSYWVAKRRPLTGLIEAALASQRGYNAPPAARRVWLPDCFWVAKSQPHFYVTLEDGRLCPGSWLPRGSSLLPFPPILHLVFFFSAAAQRPAIISLSSLTQGEPLEAQLDGLHQGGLPL